MDRFDASFNDIDPQTGRPFSSGHPDGVWLIGILYGAFLVPVLPLVMAGQGKSLQGEPQGLLLLLAALVLVLLFLPPIYWLFTRSARAVYMVFFLLALVLAAVVAALLGGLNPSLLIPAVLLQAYICFYVFGLRRDGLLN